MSSQQEKILRIFYDKELTKECATNKDGAPDVSFEEVLIPGEERKVQIFVKFVPFKESHIYEINSVVASGDARVLGYASDQHKVLKSGESFPIELLWTGRFMSLKDLEDLSAKIEISGKVRSR